MRVSRKVFIRLFCVISISLLSQATSASEVVAKMLGATNKVNATTDAKQATHQHHGPRVQASANQIELQFAESTYYVGNLYIGSDYWLSKVVFDTRTPWTGVVVSEAVGSDMPSEYTTLQSQTRIPYKPGDDDQILRKSIVTNMNKLTGDAYRDQMCLF